MGKLHELLAVDSDLKAEAQRTLSQTADLFSKGSGQLAGQVRHYTPLEDGGEPFADEVAELATTVKAELDKVSSAVAAWVDAAVQKEVTNQKTQADVEVDGKKILTGLPATALLNLESKLAEIRALYAAIPTNDPAERWKWDEQQGRFVSETRDTYRTKKVMRNHVLADATKEHPAQVQVYNEDIRVGTWQTTKFSGMLTPIEKQQRMARIDTLLRAVKQARERANNIDVVSTHVGKTIFDYING